VFLPWYRDIDKFNTGDLFLGITGPLYLAGLIVLLASIFTFGLMFLKVLGKPSPKIPLKEEHFHLLSSGFSLFMLVFAASVYFHNKFGINLVDKSMGIGMIIAFIGAGLVLLGSIMGVKKVAVSFEEEGQLDPLIDLANERKKGTIEDSSAEIDRAEVKAAVQESIDEFTSDGVSTNDVNLNGQERPRQ